jgi:hypothetical protein
VVTSASAKWCRTGLGLEDFCNLPPTIGHSRDCSGNALRKNDVDNEECIAVAHLSPSDGDLLKQVKDGSYSASVFGKLGLLHGCRCGLCPCADAFKHIYSRLVLGTALKRPFVSGF